MYCRHCGKEIPGDSKFCLRCGKSVEDPRSAGADSHSDSGKPGDIPEGTEAGGVGGTADASGAKTRIGAAETADNKVRYLRDTIVGIAAIAIIICLLGLFICYGK